MNYHGLSSSEALSLQETYGKNILPEAKPQNVLFIFLLQFKSPFIYVLLTAAIISYSLGQVLNCIFIFLVLLINAIIGTVQEYSAAKAAKALKKMIPNNVNVYRDNNPTIIPATEVVPGDLIILSSGDKIPADSKIIDSQNLSVDESMLTGESLLISKSSQDLTYAGTVVNKGRANALVEKIGKNTEIGNIALSIDDSNNKPPLLERIERFTILTSYAVVIVIAIIFLISFYRGDDLSGMFLLVIALAVSAIPEGLPAAMTVALSVGMFRMAKSNVIIRKLISVESLGSCTLIASDKTGTLTVNEITIKKVLLPDNTEFFVSGEGLNIKGEITPTEFNDSLLLLCYAGAFANEATLETTNDTWNVNGDKVDAAFLVLASKYGLDIKSLEDNFTCLQKIPYESEEAFSGSVNVFQGKKKSFVKGSPEKIISMCSSMLYCKENIALDKKLILQQTANLAQKGYKVLALAYGEDNSIKQKDLTFLGIVGMIDPLRPESKPAIVKCKSAGIDIAMITGDHPVTAQAISLQLDLAPSTSTPVTGKQLDDLYIKNPLEAKKLILANRIFARITPTQKKLIVDEFINNDHVVAVTGDGVNDAPALKSAHIGIAMGNRGTDVARENSDMILTDDNFNSIVSGIQEGRIVYNNIRKVIFLLISTGAGEIILFLLSFLFNLPLPLFPIQLLWLNLVTNGLQDVALAFEPKEGNELSSPPRKKNDHIFNKLMSERVIVNAIAIGGIAFVVFYNLIQSGLNEFQARNITLLLMVLFENVHVFNSRSETTSIFKQPFWGNPLLIGGMLTAQAIHILSMYTPVLKDVLQVEPISISLWAKLLGVAFILLIVDEAHKLYLNITK